MKKSKITCDLPLDPYADYKMEWSHDQAVRNYESVKGWIYIGLDNYVSNRAKVGLTMGDLSSRSSSSGNPGLLLFCAFKCRHDITGVQLRSIEEDLIARLDLIYTDKDGKSLRMRHFESQKLSEWYGHIDTYAFVQNVHYILYRYHYNDFLAVELENDFGTIDGCYLDCIFNECYTQEEQANFREMLLLW
ncbi:hypothetical protein [Morganella morganii]|uniref:hypothetical protein n=1 Tax=Morganella morganii TaxID=582 RepID=UPI00339C2E6D